MEEGAEPQTSLQLPEHLPRPFPAVLHLPFATMYEEPLVTFLFFKIVKVLHLHSAPVWGGGILKCSVPCSNLRSDGGNFLLAHQLRARTSRKGRFKVESSRQGHGHSGAGSHRQGFIQVNKPQKLFMAANSKARQSVAAAKERIRSRYRSHCPSLGVTRPPPMRVDRRADERGSSGMKLLPALAGPCKNAPISSERQPSLLPGVTCCRISTRWTGAKKRMATMFPEAASTTLRRRRHHQCPHTVTS